MALESKASTRSIRRAGRLRAARNVCRHAPRNLDRTDASTQVAILRFRASVKLTQAISAQPTAAAQRLSAAPGPPRALRARGDAAQARSGRLKGSPRMHASVSIDVTDAPVAAGEYRSPTSPYASANWVESVDKPDDSGKPAG